MTIVRAMPVLPTTDFEASRRFYVEVLGFEEVMDLGWIATFASPTDRSVQVSVMSHDATATVNPDVSIEVDDVDAAYAAAVAAGHEIVHPLSDEAWGVRRFFVRDPNNVIINVVSHRS